MNPIDATPKNIWEYEQNKPSLIAKDLSMYGIAKHIVFKILVARGVFKWLACRRDLIKLKNEWKNRITEAHAELLKAKKENNSKQILLLRSEIKPLEKCRKEVRSICHSERWRAPDFDREANDWLHQTK